MFADYERAHPLFPSPSLPRAFSLSHPIRTLGGRGEGFLRAVRVNYFNAAEAGSARHSELERNEPLTSLLYSPRRPAYYLASRCVAVW